MDLIRQLWTISQANDRILLEIPSRKFGVKRKGWYFVSNSIPFGRKSSAYVYHSTGLLVSHFCGQQNRGLRLPVCGSTFKHNSIQLKKVEMEPFSVCFSI